MERTLFPKASAAVAVVFVFLVVSSLFVAGAAGFVLTGTEQYRQFVHTGEGVSWVDKAVFPVYVNSSQIAVGESWTITCPLQAGRSYHVYCYGAWVNTSSAAKTDYDIYVYDPSGALESSHTEAAGLPEHLGTTENDAFFVPVRSGNYSFVIKNDARQSEGSQQATFMIIENLQCDQWYSCQIEGKDSGSQSGFYTAWGYEFLTKASNLELYVKVPASIDMYEARLYLMNNAKSQSINSIPLPWEPGLYGNVTGGVGGYNFENEAHRGVAYASCEYSGQDMYLNYTSNQAGLKLYHLVLIGEEGTGYVDFMLKTQFGNTSLSPLTKQAHALPDSSQKISYLSNLASLETAVLSYTTSNWTTASTLNMEISNCTANATIPAQEAGTYVEYRVDANDTLKNSYFASGNYSVKEQPKLTLSIEEASVMQGTNVTFTGTLQPSHSDSKVTVQFFNANATETINCKVKSDGTFTGSFAPATVGNWSVAANSPETNKTWRADSEPLVVTIEEPPIYVKYSLYIIIGLIATLAAGSAVYYLKFMRR
jgi:hypothetical protein